MNPQQILEAALNYRKAGLDPIPDHPIQKFPVGFEEWQKRDFTEEELANCILNKGWGVGLRNQEGLDFDNIGNPTARETIRDWKNLVDASCQGLVGRLLIEKTQHDGYHVAWTCEVIEGSQKLASRKATSEELIKKPDEKIKSFIETRGKGAQFVVSPTPGYKVLQGDWCNLPTITPEERDIIIGCAKSLDLMPIKTEGFNTTKSNFTGERPGDLYNQNDGVIEALELLKGEGWREVYTSGDVIYLRRPGKDCGISASYNHIAPGIFYNFSSNGSPFEVNKAYTPFAILSLLKNDGDFSKAASDLAKRYGIRNTPNEECLNTPKTAWPQQLNEAAYQGIAGEFVWLIEPESEADPVALLVNFLTAFCSIVGPKPYHLIEADKHKMQIFAVLVGKSSKGRKGTSWGYITNAFFLVDPEWKKRVQSGLSSGEGVIWAVRDPISRTEPIKENKQIVNYQEVVVDPGIEDKRLLVVESEFAGTLRVLNREGNTLSPVIRDAWDTGRLQSLTKNSPASAATSHISILGHITIEELLRFLSITESFNGFANRFLWVCSRRSKVKPHGGKINEEVFDKLVTKLREIVKFAKNVESIEFDSQAYQLWADIYPHLSEEIPGLLGAVKGRAEAYVKRLACIYALQDKSDLVKFLHLRAAVALWDYVDDSIDYIFQGRTGDPLAEKIIEALSKKPDGVSRADIFIFFGKNVPSEQISLSLEILETSGQIKSHTLETAGRPKTLFTLNTFNGSASSKKSYLESLDEYANKRGFNATTQAQNNSESVNVKNVISLKSEPRITHNEISISSLPGLEEYGY